MSKIKNGGSDQYGAGLFEQQQFGAAGVEGVKQRIVKWRSQLSCKTSKHLGTFSSDMFSLSS